MTDFEHHFDAGAAITALQIHPADPNVEYVPFNTACEWAWENERVGPEVILAHILAGTISIAMRKSRRGKLSLVLNADDVCMALMPDERGMRVVVPGTFQSAD